MAKEACDGGRVTLVRQARQGRTEVKPGDVMEIRFGNRLGRYEVLSVSEVVRKEEASQMYRLLSEDEGMAAERG